MTNYDRDLERFAGVGEAAQAKATAILEIFTGANLQAEFGFDLDAAVKAWALELLDYPLELLTDVARAWCRTESKFPSESQFLDLCERARRRHALTDPSYQCLECRDSEVGPGLVVVDRWPSGRVRNTTPCGTCNAVKKLNVDEGHYEPNHICDPTCPGWDKRRKRGRAA